MQHHYRLMVFSKTEHYWDSRQAAKITQATVHHKQSFVACSSPTDPRAYRDQFLPVAVNQSRAKSKTISIRKFVNGVIARIVRVIY